LGVRTTGKCNHGLTLANKLIAPCHGAAKFAAWDMPGASSISAGRMACHMARIAALAGITGCFSEQMFWSAPPCLWLMCRLGAGHARSVSPAKAPPEFPADPAVDRQHRICRLAPFSRRGGAYRCCQRRVSRRAVAVRPGALAWVEKAGVKGYL